MDVRAVDHSELFLRCSSERATGQSTATPVLHVHVMYNLGFYRATLDSNLLAIFSDELKNSVIKILHYLPIILHLSEDFSN